MSKPVLVDQIREQLKEQLNVMQAAAAEARENATGDETRSDGKYDTRAIEAGYLAGAQARQADQLAEAVRLFESFEPPAYRPGENIGPGALVECEHEGEIVFYLLAPAAGGLTLPYEGFDCIVLSTDSVIYQELLGATSGQVLEGSGIMVMSMT